MLSHGVLPKDSQSENEEDELSIDDEAIEQLLLNDEQFNEDN